MTPYTCIVIDDENHARESLQTLIKICDKNLTVVAECSDVDSALKSLVQHKPQIVFLDIALGEQSAFQLLERLKSINFQLIFTTAYSEYAIKAFKVNAIEYLLKPINLNELREAIDKAIGNLQFNKNPAQIENLIRTIDSEKPQRLAISSVDGITFVNIEEIIRLEGSGNYTSITMNNNTIVTASKGLKHFESILPIGTFFRAHQSHLININAVIKIQSKDGYIIELNNGDLVPLVRNKKDSLVKRMM